MTSTAYDRLSSLPNTLIFPIVAFDLYHGSLYSVFVLTAGCPFWHFLSPQIVMRLHPPWPISYPSTPQ